MNYFSVIDQNNHIISIITAFSRSWRDILKPPYKHWIVMTPPRPHPPAPPPPQHTPKGGGHIVFGTDPVGVGVGVTHFVRSVTWIPLEYFMILGRNWCITGWDDVSCTRMTTLAFLHLRLFPFVLFGYDFVSALLHLRLFPFVLFGYDFVSAL